MLHAFIAIIVASVNREKKIFFKIIVATLEWKNIFF